MQAGFSLVNPLDSFSCYVRTMNLSRTFKNGHLCAASEHDNKVAFSIILGAKSIEFVMREQTVAGQLTVKTET